MSEGFMPISVDKAVCVCRLQTTLMMRMIRILT